VFKDGNEKWRVKVEGKQHLVKYRARLLGDGEALFDGTVVGLMGFIMVGATSIKVFLNRWQACYASAQGIMSQHFDLILEEEKT